MWPLRKWSCPPHSSAERVKETSQDANNKFYKPETWLDKSAAYDLKKIPNINKRHRRVLCDTRAQILTIMN